MKNKTGIVHKFAYSIYNFKEYKNFLSQGLFSAILYLFLVSLVFSTLGNISNLRMINDDVTRLENVFVKESPEFELKDGVLSIDSEAPVIYKYNSEFSLSRATLGDVFISDTSGTTDISVLDDYDNATYINSTSLYAKRNGQIIFSFDFADFNYLTFTKETFRHYFSVLKITFVLTLLIINPLLDFINILAAIFIVLGPMGLMLSKNFKQKIGYLQCCIIGMYAVTLPIILKSLATILDIYSFEFTLVFYGISFIYATMAIKNMDMPKKIDTIL